jgi:hypothetical protein
VWVVKKKMFTEINLYDLEIDIWDAAIKITKYLTPLEMFVNIMGHLKGTAPVLFLLFS